MDAIEYNIRKQHMDIETAKQRQTAIDRAHKAFNQGRSVSGTSIQTLSILFNQLLHNKP